ncbi:hypothetical protein QJS66_14970 [Kocuria rhizophila]|nr:hypothetical protein QJS66_14970 [Kocuria rhizophila]
MARGPVGVACSCDGLIWSFRPTATAGPEPVPSSAITTAETTSTERADQTEHRCSGSRHQSHHAPLSHGRARTRGTPGLQPILSPRAAQRPRLRRLASPRSHRPPHPGPPAATTNQVRESETTRSKPASHPPHRHHSRGGPWTTRAPAPSTGPAPGSGTTGIRRGSAGRRVPGAGEVGFEERLARRRRLRLGRPSPG